jgi:hypothetical protein
MKPAGSERKVANANTRSPRGPLADCRAKLPASTTFLLDLSALLRRVAPALQLIPIGIVSHSAWIRTNEQGARFWSRALLAIPVVKSLRPYALAAHVCECVVRVAAAGPRHRTRRRNRRSGNGASVTQAALTGHLALSTLHMNDAPTTITHRLDLDVGAYLVASMRDAVLAQRQVRAFCKMCRKGRVPEESLLRRYGLIDRGNPESGTVRAATRVATLAEVLRVATRIRTPR